MLSRYRFDFPALRWISWVTLNKSLNFSKALLCSQNYKIDTRVLIYQAFCNDSRDTHENRSCWFFVFLFFFFFLGPHLWHMEVSSLGVESELQLLAYITATAMPDSSHVCDLHHSSQQHWILNPMFGARY